MQCSIVQALALSTRTTERCHQCNRAPSQASNKQRALTSPTNSARCAVLGLALIKPLFRQTELDRSGSKRPPATAHGGYALSCIAHVCCHTRALCRRFKASAMLASRTSQMPMYHKINHAIRPDRCPHVKHKPHMTHTRSEHPVAVLYVARQAESTHQAAGCKTTRDACAPR